METTESRAFTTEAKTRRHLLNATPTHKRAARLMELLFQGGFVKEAPCPVVRQFVTKEAHFIGLDQGVIEGYIGRPKTTLWENQNPRTDLYVRYLNTGVSVQKEYSAVKILPQKEGICQKLGYMRFEYRKNQAFLIFSHEAVPLSYHAQETSLARSDCSKDDLCVSPIPSSKEGKETCIETSERSEREETLKSTHKLGPKI